MFLIIITNLSLCAAPATEYMIKGGEELIGRERLTFIQAAARYVVATDFTVCKSDELRIAVLERPNV